MVKTPLRKRARAQAILKVLAMPAGPEMDQAVYEAYPLVMPNPIYGTPSPNWAAVVPFLNAAGLRIVDVHEFMHKFHIVEPDVTEPWCLSACQLLILKAQGITP